MSNEDEIIKKRLLIEGDSGNEDRCINKLIKLFIKYCDDPSKKDESDDTQSIQSSSYEMMMALISHIEFGLLRNQLLLDMNKNEQENYENLYKKVDLEIEKSKANIFKYKMDLEEARKIRKNRQEYDILAREIIKLPDRTQMQGNIELLTKKLEDLKQQKCDLDKKIDLRRKQFSVVLQSLNTLKSLLENDQYDEVQELNDDAHDVQNKMETSTIEETSDDETKSPQEQEEGFKHGNKKMDLDE